MSAAACQMCGSAATSIDAEEEASSLSHLALCPTLQTSQSRCRESDTWLLACVHLKLPHVALPACTAAGGVDSASAARVSSLESYSLTSKHLLDTSPDSTPEAPASSAVVGFIRHSPPRCRCQLCCVWLSSCAEAPGRVFAEGCPSSEHSTVLS